MKQKEKIDLDMAVSTKEFAKNQILLNAQNFIVKWMVKNLEV